MRKFRCKREFLVDNYDADGFLIENKQTVIKAGTVYELDESGSSIIGGEVRLDNITNGSRLEMRREQLMTLFEEVDICQ